MSPSFNRSKLFAKQKKNCSDHHEIYDIWHMTYDVSHMTYDVWHMTYDIWHIVILIHGTWFWHSRSKLIWKPYNPSSKTCNLIYIIILHARFTLNIARRNYEQSRMIWSDEISIIDNEIFRSVYRLRVYANRIGQSKFQRYKFLL